MGNERKILYVDDEPINRLIFAKLMGKTYTVLTAEGGAQGLELLASDPDIYWVVTDMSMPAMTGLEMVQQARVEFPDKKYFMLSGYAINPEIQKALDAGLLLQYFTKPADFEQIHRALQACAE